MVMPDRDVPGINAKTCLGQAQPGIYELGGPDVSDFREWMKEMLAIIKRRALIVNTPMPIAKLMGRGFDLIKSMTFGLIAGPLTLDQVKNLGQDNIVGDGVKTFADLGIQPMATEAVLPDYLWRFRPSGQYAASNDSAENLHSDTDHLKGGTNRAGFS